MLHVLWLAVRAAHFTQREVRTAFQIIPTYLCDVWNTSLEYVSSGVVGGESYGRLENVGGGRSARAQ